MKPKIICHMASSLDGRILPSRWTPKDAHSHTAYEDLHTRFGVGSWIVGRVTAAEFSRRDAYPTATNDRFPREAWLPRKDSAIT